MTAPTEEHSEEEPWIVVVRACIAGLAFGAVEITVHERQVVQVEKRERHRLPTLSSLHRTRPQRQKN